MTHQGGDDSEGCLACWEDAAFEAVPAIPDGPWCMEPKADAEGRCVTCGHFVEPTPALPMTGECE